MAEEIERKFLVSGDAWKSLATGVLYRQGYLSTVNERTVRVRTIGEQGFLTVKGITVSITRLEFEYEIPYADAERMLSQLVVKPIIEKKRYTLAYGDSVWEVDEFLGANQGLVVAEIEVDHADAVFDKPDWIGEEVSHDARYFNNNLVRHPYTTWSVHD